MSLALGNIVQSVPNVIYRENCGGYRYTPIVLLSKKRCGEIAIQKNTALP